MLAQALVLLAVVLASYSETLMNDPYAWQIYGVCTSSNLLLIGLNLLPIPPLDGAHAWPLIPKLLQRRRDRLARQQQRKRHNEIARLSTDLANGRMSPELEAQLKSIIDDK